MSMNPSVAILHAPGTNRDQEAALACELAGGAPEIVYISQLRVGERRLRDYQMLVLPGGFTYGDALGAGKLLALDLQVHLGEELAGFIEAGKPVLGICNGFQALVKAGLLTANCELSIVNCEVADDPRFAIRHSPFAIRHLQFTLARNANARFECRWVYLQPEPESRCVFTQGLDDLVYCPVAHGEGRFMVRDEETLARLRDAGQVALTYVDIDGRPAQGRYPLNPNGSMADIAGVCNPQGNVLGLMPHPEDHVLPHQHPRWARGQGGRLGLRLFENGIRYAADL
jgi:phosphoribosylformylglycinamidine synthase